MATLAQLRTKIAARLQDQQFQSISAANVDSVINISVGYYKYRRYWFNETMATLTLTQGSPNITGVPSDFLYELKRGGISLISSNQVIPLEKVPSEVYDLQNIQGIGRPYMYTYRNNGFEVYFYPDTAYTATLRYIKDYDVLTADGDSNDFIVIAEQMVLYNSLSRIYAEFKQDPNNEDYYTNRARDEEENLLRRGSALSGSGTLTKDSLFLR